MPIVTYPDGTHRTVTNLGGGGKTCSPARNPKRHTAMQTLAPIRATASGPLRMLLAASSPVLFPLLAAVVALPLCVLLAACGTVYVVYAEAVDGWIFLKNLCRALR